MRLLPGKQVLEPRHENTATEGGLKRKKQSEAAEASTKKSHDNDTYVPAKVEMRGVSVFDDHVEEQNSPPLFTQPFDVDAHWMLKEIATYETECRITNKLKTHLDLAKYAPKAFGLLFEEEEFIKLFDSLKSIITHGNYILTSNQKRFLYFCCYLITDQQYKFFVDNLKQIFGPGNDENLCLFILGRTIPHFIVRLVGAKFSMNAQLMWKYFDKQLGYSYFK